MVFRQVKAPAELRQIQQPKVAQLPINLMPRIRVFLFPVMSRATRSALNQIELVWAAHNPSTAYLFLAIVRSVIEMKMDNNPRVRQGLIMLLQNIKMTQTQITQAMLNSAMMTKYGVLRPSENQMFTAITNYLKLLDIKNGR